MLQNESCSQSSTDTNKLVRLYACLYINEINSYFQVIYNLQQKLRQQEEEIEKLKEKLRRLSNEQDEHMSLGSPV